MTAKTRCKRYYEKNRQKILDWQKQWRESNPEEHKARLQRWRSQNPEKVREQSRRQYKKHKAAMVARTANRRAEYFGLEGRLTAADIEALGDQCPCGAPGTILDHKIALAFGGPNHPSNIQRLCDDCNRVKTASDVKEAHARGLIRRGPSPQR